MAALRNPDGGCPWDLRQDFRSIAPHTLEEAYEVVDAIDSGDPADIRDELGDLLFQVVFLARLAEECGWFDFAAVAGGLSEKLIRRHPHVFGDAATDDVEQVNAQWAAIKETERAERRGGAPPGALDGVPRALPALSRAAKLGRRAARVGFDWPDAAAVRGKVDEELAELDAAVAGGDPAGIADECGDSLFSLAQLVRHLGLDPEAVLRDAGTKFERRFRAMEAAARADGTDLGSLDEAALERRWQRAKTAAGGA